MNSYLLRCSRNFDSFIEPERFSKFCDPGTGQPSAYCYIILNKDILSFGVDMLGTDIPGFFPHAFLQPFILFTYYFLYSLF